jgi:hypothetical protein
VASVILGYFCWKAEKRADKYERIILDVMPQQNDRHEQVAADGHGRRADEDDDDEEGGRGASKTSRVSGQERHACRGIG